MSDNAMKLPSKAIMRKLWETMTDIYGNHWINNHGDHDKNDTWRKGLYGVTPTMLGMGIKHMLKANLVYPPNLVEFRHYCFDVPDKQRAIYLTVHGGLTTDPFIKAMRATVGQWQLRTESTKVLEKKAAHAYDLVVNQQIDATIERLEKTGVYLSLIKNDQHIEKTP